MIAHPGRHTVGTQDLLNRAKELKNLGNVEFGQGRWQMAIESYREGLAELPDTRAHGRSVSVKGKERSCRQAKPTRRRYNTK